MPANLHVTVKRAVFAVARRRLGTPQGCAARDAEPNRPLQADRQTPETALAWTELRLRPSAAAGASARRATWRSALPVAQLPCPHTRALQRQRQDGDLGYG